MYQTHTKMSAKKKKSSVREETHTKKKHLKKINIVGWGGGQDVTGWPAHSKCHPTWEMLKQLQI